jgi:hypothetical protein
MREIAMKLLGRGLYLFPLRRRGKLPAHKGWRDEATRDPATVERWIADGYNLGVETEKSGLIVIDCDVKHDGVDGIANFLAMCGGLEPETLTVETASGGRHYYFFGPAVKSTASVVAPGVDVKSRGGYVVAPGSVVKAGPYKVVKDW